MKLLSKQHKKNISNALKGKLPKNFELFLKKAHEMRLGQKHSEETKRKMSDAHKGKKPYKMTEGIKKKISESKKGTPSWNKGLKNWMSKEGKLRMIKSKLGKSPWNKRKKSPQLSGENHWNWHGGISLVNERIRHSLEYKLWSDSVWNRDNNSCQKCGDNRLEKLVAHHILNFAQWQEFRFAIDNGITFCRKCHNWFHRIYGKKNNNLEQIKEFIEKK